MTQENASERQLGLWGATGVGVGAIVGGGILALSGVAFAAAGPAAIVAFAVNGAIALLTALSFASMSRAFPESGGTYTFAKKVLSVETAFMVGWVVWFASIVAAVLYALGFASFFTVLVVRIWHHAGGEAPPHLQTRAFQVAIAMLATGAYTLSLLRRSAGGGQWATVGKVLVFGVVIAAGAIAFLRTPAEESLAPLRPFFHDGFDGVMKAMGYTFIAMQGFDLIAAVGGEVKDPARNLPRSMVVSLLIALAIYLPLLFLTATVGVAAGESVTALGAAHPEELIAIAAERFMGPSGWWLVVVAAILSMLSALVANLYGASRVAMAMARDRTLPAALARVYEPSGVPAAAVATTGAAVVVILLLIPDVAAAGAASSLIFLISFAMVHWSSILVSRRRPSPRPHWSSHVRGVPIAPVIGAIACLALAVFQGFAVREAGRLAAVWLVFGTALYLVRFAPRARVADASAQAADPELQRLRGLSPLVLVPIANPATAAGLVSVAGCLAAPGVGRALLLSIVRPPEELESAQRDQQLRDVQSVLGHSLETSFEAHLRPETLITVSSEPWSEIERTARTHHCECLLLGLGRIDDAATGRHVERLMERVDSDVVVLRAPSGFRLQDVRRVLVPVGGRRDHSSLRARLLSSLNRSGVEQLTFLRVMPAATPARVLDRIERELRELVQDEVAGRGHVVVVVAEDPLEEIARRAQQADLVVLGIRRDTRRSKGFGELPTRIARRTASPMLLLSRRG